MGLFYRAKMMMQGRSAPSPSRGQYYRVACNEGHVLHGQRTDGYQALRCPTCNEGIFVLPRSPLPEPTSPAKVRPGGRPSPASPLGDDLVLTEPPSPAEITAARAGFPAGPAQPMDDEAEIDWIDDAPPVRPPRPQAPASRPTGKASRPASVARPAKVNAEVVAIPEGMIAVAEGPSLREWASKRRNSLVVVAVLLVVFGTIAFRVRQRSREDLPRIAEIGRTEGLAKLDLGDFHVAKQVLGDASAAVDALGGQYEDADAIRQGAREAALFADRVGEGLEALVEKAARGQPGDGWTSQFDALYRGQSVLFDARVVALPDPSRPGSGYRIDYQVFYGGGPTTPAGKGRVDLAGFQLFDQARPKLGDHVVFGGRLASIGPVDSEGYFPIALIADSGAFLTHDKAVAIAFNRPDGGENGDEP